MQRERILEIARYQREVQLQGGGSRLGNCLIPPSPIRSGMSDPRFMPDPRDLSAGELRALVMAVEKDPETTDLRDLVTTVLNTGVRASELLALRWKDVDFVARHFLVATSAGTRRIPFGYKTLSILKGRWKREPATSYVLGPNPDYSLDRLSRQLQIVSNEANGKPITFDSLRRAFFVRWASFGGNLDLLALVAGIGTIRFVIKSHLSRDERYALAVAFQAWLEEQPL